jgi:hypothetical protein
MQRAPAVTAVTGDLRSVGTPALLRPCQEQLW